MSVQQILDSIELTDIAPSPRYMVILHNDDYTTMDFVIEVLMKFFRHSYEKANEIMLKIHHEGRGICGIYNFEIAETKVYQVKNYARKHEFPLRCTMEKLPAC